MSGRLPVGASLEGIQKEARALLHAFEQNDIIAAARYCPSEVLDGTSHVRLADAQCVLARHYGFKSWASLKTHLFLDTP